MTLNFKLYHTNNGPCPYRNKGIWENLTFETETLPGATYEKLLNHGFRRSGCSVYHPICNNCHLCIPLRVDVKQFRMTKSQRRTWQKNQDLCIEHYPVDFSRESFELYQKYQVAWHHNSEKPDFWEFQNFLIESPVDTEMAHYYLGDLLVGVSWIDRLPSAISSVYFIFHPDFAFRRLGVYSILYEIEYCRELKIPWLYLGFWVKDSYKMNYKAEYRPAQVLVRGQWQDLQTPCSSSGIVRSTGWEPSDSSTVFSTQSFTGK